MPQDLFPPFSPYPRSLLGWDGVDFRVIRVDDQGTVHARGEDQLFSYRLNYSSLVEVPNAVLGDNNLNCPPCDPDRVLVVTTIVAWNADNACTYLMTGISTGAGSRWVRRAVAPVADSSVEWSGHLYLDEGDFVRAYFRGCVLNDSLSLMVTGYTFTRD